MVSTCGRLLWSTAMTSGPFDLDLRELPKDVELCPPIAEMAALAASMTLDRFHGQGPPYAAKIIQKRPVSAGIQAVGVNELVRASFGDAQEATELGAVAIALSVARRVFGRVVFARLPKRTGADYLMRAPGASGDDYERLECSGIGDGSETGRQRLGEKVRQLARYPTRPPGYAIVTHFRARPVEVHVATWPR